VLRDLDLKRRYRSHQDHLVRDFYVPCLGEAVAYRRAVGFFSSAALSTAAQGLPAFLRAGGTMRLVASPHLSEDDLEAIVGGFEQRARTVTETITAELLDRYPDPIRERLGFLGWLISRGRLDIQLATVRRSQGTAGIYHEKIGVFEDAAGDRVAFQGSANESRGGLRSNFESIVVFRSWLPQELEDVDAIDVDFEALWENRTENLEVFAFPEAAKEALVRLAPADVPDRDPEEGGAEPEEAADEEATRPARPRQPDRIELRSYQRDALVAWLRNDARGILEMATGTGKTYTALAAVTHLQEHLEELGKQLFCVVVCPYQHLVRQWSDAAKEFGIKPVLCYLSRSHWQDELTAQIHAVRTAKTPFAMAVATNMTFAGSTFTEIARDLPAQTLLIADEAHNLGADKGREALTDSYRYRLALSATPDRAFDPEGSKMLTDYFGGVVFSFGLEEAIAAGALTPYDYHPQLVYLEDEELDRYLELTAKIAKMHYAGEEAHEVEGPLLTFLVQRARVIGAARGKLGRLAEVVRPLRDTQHNLFYCGDGAVDLDTGAGERQLDAVVRLLGNQIGMRVQSYTQENAAEERDVLRDRFASGDLQGLVAIRCLDEGVDIPETRRAFILASGTNPRQFVQRRGRVLRRAPGKTSAEIYDFLVLPPPGSVEGNLWQTERRLVERELNRIALFARLARNGTQALDSLAEVRDRYGLVHIG